MIMCCSLCSVWVWQLGSVYITVEFYDRVDGDMHMGFGGLKGRGAKKQDPPIEKDLALSLEEIFHGCVKKMKISRRVRMSSDAFLTEYCLVCRALHTKCNTSVLQRMQYTLHIFALIALSVVRRHLQRNKAH